MFHEKTVIITGSGAGIGREAAIQFAREGASVVVNSISPRGMQVCDEIRAMGGSALFVQADVSTEEGSKRVVDQTVKTFRSIHILVNNAGIVHNGGLEEPSTADWDRSMAVNVRSVFLMSKYCLPELRRSKGCIINTASAIALKGVFGRALYSATKGAILSLSRSMAREYVQDGIRVNCISPSTVLTPSLQERINASSSPEEAMATFVSRHPIGRLGTCEEIAAAILYLASDQAGFITAANLVLDGGMTM